MARLDWAADCHASGTVKRAALAAKSNLEPIALCGHCVGQHRPALEADGWVIEPIRGHAPASGVGTESTGLHYALEG